MWIALWVVLSAFVLTIFIWSMQILQQQKRAWSAFAKKGGVFTYIPGKMMESPSLRGGIRGLTVSLYTDIQRTNDIRGQRFVTVIEVEAGKGMPTGAILATRELAPFVASLNFSETMVPVSPNWDESYLIRTRSADRLRAYLTPARIEALHGLFSMKNSVALYFFDEQDSVLRMETPNPLKDAALLEKSINKIVGFAEKLKLTDEEQARYAPPPPPAAPAVAETALAAAPAPQEAPAASEAAPETVSEAAPAQTPPEKAE
jgi:hypothetical protein